MQTDNREKLRQAITALDAKLDPEKMPGTKLRLHLALQNLDDYEKTGNVASLRLALDICNEVSRVMGERPSEGLQ